MTGTQIIERVTDTLQDKDNIRWPRLELLRYINDAQREIVLYRPDSSAKTTQVALVANTRQDIPLDGIRLIEVVRNFTSPTAAGKAVRLTAREVLDGQVPLWHQSGPSSVISHFMFDLRNPRTFYVYPVPIAGSLVEVIYSSYPTDLSVEASVISLDDIYANAIIYYTIMRAYQKDEDYARNTDVANQWGMMFMKTLGVRTTADSEMSPNNSLGTDKSR